MRCVVEYPCEVQASETSTDGKVKMAMEDSEIVRESSFSKRSLELQFSIMPVSRVGTCLSIETHLSS
jgi:hypothetical protein